MQHFYSDFFFCKNNFFNNADRIIDFASSLDYNFTDKSFPGTRTENLSTLNDNSCIEFSNMFAQKLVNEVYTNITSMSIDIRFHKYPLYSQDKLNPINSGWVHTDHEMLAGVLYLNEVNDFDSGTSLYTPNNSILPPNVIREAFNVNPLETDNALYVEHLQKHNGQFSETLKAGNLFNRLITYDSKIYHKPNNYFIGNNDNRLTLLFVISNYECKPRQFNISE